MKTAVILLIMAIGFEAKSQTCTDCDTLSTKSEIFYHAHEFSAIAVINGIAYLPAEKCKMMYRYDIARQKVVDSIPFNNGALLGKAPGIEAAAVYHDHIFLTDEEWGCLYSFNTQDGSITSLPVDPPSKERLKLFVGEAGIEGLAVDEANRICYVLRERNGNNESLIMAYRITSAPGGGDSLAYLDECHIRHPNARLDGGRYLPDIRRYCDLYYDSATQHLFCLKSYYPGDWRVAEYAIDTLDARLNAHNKFRQHILESDGLEWRNLTDYVRDKGGMKYNNIEGLARWGNKLYIISDNLASSECHSDSLMKKPVLFFSLKM